MSSDEIIRHIIHQAFFGGVSALGFAVLFNCTPRILWVGFISGMLALATRTFCQDIFHLGLPAASFFGSLLIASLNRWWWEDALSLRGPVLAIVGSIPMVPGSLAAKGLYAIFLMINNNQVPGSLPPVELALENLIIGATTLVGIGTALAIPAFFPDFPDKNEEEA